jgi:hypothetical protein
VSTNSKSNQEKQVVGFVGVGLDNDDEHRRLTENDYFLIVGGSEETHEQMQDLSIRFTQSLKKRGKQLPETSVEEVIELFHKAAGK